jgi:type I restriction enzyme R subunit
VIGLAEVFRQSPYLDEYHQKARVEYLDWAHERVAALNRKSFTVKMVLRYVDQFSDRNNWNALTNEDRHNIYTHLARLIFIPEDDEKAKRFDQLMTSFQLAVAENDVTQQHYCNKVRRIASQLSRILNIHEVARVQNIIRSATTDVFWVEKTHAKLETVRESYRHLIKYIPENETVIYQTDFEDELLGINVVEDVEGGYRKSDNYKLKVERYIRENSYHITIQKLRKNIKLTSAELHELERLVFVDSQIGTKEDFIQNYGEQPLGRFIRTILGMDEEATKEAFSEFIDHGNLRSDQIQFVRSIVTHFKNNGILELSQLA